MQPDEYEKLGSYALIGLPEKEYTTRYTSSREEFLSDSARGCPSVDNVLKPAFAV